MLAAHRILTALALTWLLSPTTLPTASAQQEALPTTSDFPYLDSSLASMVEQGAQAKKAALMVAQAPFAPDTIEILIDINRSDPADRIPEALYRLRRLVAGDADDLEAAARIVSSRWREIQEQESRGYRQDVTELVTSIRARVPELPREQAARTVRWLIPIETRLGGGRDSDLRSLMRVFVEEYAGTEAALLAQVDILGFTRDMRQEIEDLGAFAREHAGTVAGAKALYMKAFQLTFNALGTEVAPRDADPTERFLQVRAIAEDLESRRWPPCEWVDQASDLIPAFFVSRRAVFETDGIDRMLDVYRAFVVERFDLADEYSPHDGIGYVITGKMGNLHERRGDRVDGVDATFDALEQEVANVDALRHLRAEFYIERAQSHDPGDRPALIRKATALLTAQSQTATETYRRKALAALAALHFEERTFDAAAAAYRSYLEQWPESDWAWVAALRLGQIKEAAGDWEGAADRYVEAARGYPSPALSAMLAYTSAARASETLGRFDDALRHYNAAASVWDEHLGLADNEERLEQLTASMGFSGGALLEKGRRLIDLERWRDARDSLEELLREYPGSPLAAEALYLAHRTRFENALDVADVEAGQPDAEAALAEFEALANEPWDPAVGAAALARAVLLGKSGHLQEARVLTAEALQEWLTRQERFYESAPTDSMYADVRAIRNIVFRPQGGAFYDGADPRWNASDSPRSSGKWNAFDWPDQLPPFLIVDPDIMVQLSDGGTTRMRVAEDLPGLDNVVFMTQEQRAFLAGILSHLGGTQTRRPGSPRETPNQPIGGAVDIMEMWQELFPARPGHWGGWVLTAYPRISRIEFHDEERTRAAARVTIGYSGCSVVLEKQDGVWVALKLTDFWIT